MNAALLIFFIIYFKIEIFFDYRKLGIGEELRNNHKPKKILQHGTQTKNSNWNFFHVM